jgi:hypothetical protein
MKQLGKVPDDLLVREPENKEVPVHFLPALYPAFLRCPSCGSSDVELVGGNNVKVTKVRFS